MPDEASREAAPVSGAVSCTHQALWLTAGLRDGGGRRLPWAWQSRFDSWIRKIPWRRECLPTPVSFPGESHGQRSLAGYSPWGRKESDTTERQSTEQQLRFYHMPVVRSGNLFFLALDSSLSMTGVIKYLSHC